MSYVFVWLRTALCNFVYISYCVCMMSVRLVCGFSIFRMVCGLGAYGVCALSVYGCAFVCIVLLY